MVMDARCLGFSFDNSGFFPHSALGLWASTASPQRSFRPLNGPHHHSGAFSLFLSYSLFLIPNGRAPSQQASKPASIQALLFLLGHDRHRTAQHQLGYRLVASIAQGTAHIPLIGNNHAIISVVRQPPALHSSRDDSFVHFFIFFFSFSFSSPRPSRHSDTTRHDTCIHGSTCIHPSAFGGDRLHSLITPPYCVARDPGYGSRRTGRDRMGWVDRLLLISFFFSFLFCVAIWLGWWMDTRGHGGKEGK